jgi:hypothetical protein
LQDLGEVRRFVNWWIDHRQSTYGDFGGGLSDDSDLVQQWPGLALMGVDTGKVNRSLIAVSEAVYRNGMITNGLGTIATDELHAYEEGLNADAARLYLNWGEPRTVERLMTTTKALEGVILRNPAGHLHFASNWYSGKAMVREGAWEWQKPYSFTVMHGPILLGLFNGASRPRALVTGLVDGWMAHGTRGTDGLWTYPNEVNWRTDAVRAGDGGGANTPLQSAYAAWRFTGETKYLQPIDGRLAKSATLIGEFNEPFDLVPGGPAKRDALAAKPNATPLSAYAAYSKLGDLAPLTAHHAEEAADKAAHAYMYTEGHWWSDRVEQPSEILQRERLGGIALRRNQTWPGHTLSWRFADETAGAAVAILVKQVSLDRFTVTAFNTSARAQDATMTAWNVAPGRWTMRSGQGPAQEITLERSASTPVSFAPGTTTTIEFARVAPGTPVENRPDLGIGADDVAVKGRDVTLTVHSLGARATTGGFAALVAADGRELARAALPVLAAPIDLSPRTTSVRLRLPGNATGVRVRVGLPGDAPEITRMNNEVVIRP